MTLQQVHVRKDELTNATLVEADTAPLADGAVRFKVESFSVTANNITYAVVGDGFMYWNFFPPKADNPERLGIVPMWGHAVAIESNSDECHCRLCFYRFRHLVDNSTIFLDEFDKLINARILLVSDGL